MTRIELPMFSWRQLGSNIHAAAIKKIRAHWKSFNPWNWVIIPWWRSLWMNSVFQKMNTLSPLNASLFQCLQRDTDRVGLQARKMVSIGVAS
jgi:hypothetical protein